MQNRTKFTSTNLPAYERCLEAQVVILVVIFSARVLHSTLESLLAVIGSPKYVNGSYPSVNLVKAKHSAFTVVHLPPKTIWDLDKFALSLVQ